MQIFPRFSCTLYREEEYLMQESVVCMECLISSGVSRGFSPAGCIPELWVGLRFLGNGVGGLERLLSPLCLQGWGSLLPTGLLWHQASQEETAQRDFVGFSQAKPRLFPLFGSALEVFCSPCPKSSLFTPRFWPFAVPWCC